jgi:hypothetical protein
MSNAEPTTMAVNLESDVPWDTIQLAASSALLAVSNAKPEEAALIAGNLHGAFGNYVQIGLVAASVSATSGRLAEALGVLEDLVKSRPDIDATLCACAVLRKELGVSGWRPLAQRVLQQASDPDAVRIARELLHGGQNVTERKATAVGTAALRFA